MSDDFGTSDYHFNKISETAGQLEEYVHSLLAARKRLEAENKRLLGVIEYLEDSPQGRLAAENEGLREALLKIKSSTISGSGQIAQMHHFTHTTAAKALDE